MRRKPVRAGDISDSIRLFNGYKYNEVESPQRVSRGSNPLADGIMRFKSAEIGQEVGRTTVVQNIRSTVRGELSDRALELRQKVFDRRRVRENVSLVEKLIVRLVNHFVSRQLMMEVGDER